MNCLFPRTVYRSSSASFSSMYEKGTLGFRTRTVLSDGCKEKYLVGVGSRRGWKPSDDKEVGYSGALMQVPCGHCINCLKKRQNDFSIRLYREAERRGSMFFVTLTYDDNTVPLACRIVSINKETGELTYESPSFPFVRLPKGREYFGRSYEYIVRGKLNSIKPGRSPRYVYMPFTPSSDFSLNGDLDLLSGLDYKYQFTPSLYVRDVQLWLKRARVSYERTYKKKFSDFSYAGCGEMGPNTCRPHYHFCFMGLTRHEVDFLCNLWKEDYGFVYVEQVKRINDDKSDGFLKVARYIGKYISKGKFECDSVKCKDALSVRLLTSKHMGTVLDDNLISYYRGYDLFGKYNINTGLLQDGSSLTDAQYKALFDACFKRSFIVLGDLKYSLPNVYKKQIWFVQAANGSFVSSFVRKKIVSFARDLSERLYLEQYREMLSSLPPGEVASILYQDSINKEVSAVSEEFAGEYAYSSGLYSSIF